MGRETLQAVSLACADDTDEPLQKMNLLAGIIFRYRHNGFCRSVGRPVWRKDNPNALPRYNPDHPPAVGSGIVG